ncbi:MAG: histidine--tRNA ligase [Pirellulales bacterium]|nr:histidine--tRNA ligase [Pirellulales bacterium]
MMPRERLIETARQVYRSYGFAPIDTPTLEYLEILTGKGSEETDKQLYKFEDQGGRNVGMRFDLTVPLARFSAMHVPQLGTPFKRYHIATVWRGEAPQAGRYREFMQCDFDTIGTTSSVSDIETTLVIHDLLRAIGFSAFTIRINNRLVLTGLLEKLGLSEKSTLVLRALDKLAKIGPDKVVAEMTEIAGASQAQATAIVNLANVSEDVGGDSSAVLSRVAPMVSGNEKGEAGVELLQEHMAAVSAAGVSPQAVRLDVAIARGLDYYTGVIYETFLNDLPGIGSVCSGGRYDNLAGLYTKQQLPGVGASLGLDRLLAAMEQLGLIEKVRTPADVFIPFFDETRLHDYLRIAAELRAAGLGVEFYPESKKLDKQLKYADKRGFRFALIIGGHEFAEGKAQLKDLAQRESVELILEDQCAAIAAEVEQRR